MARRKKLTAKEAAREPFLPLIRALVEAAQAFERCDTARLRSVGLTSPQGDVIFTLGNTPGMTFRELGERTLITKGTLTGIVDRLEEKGLVIRDDHERDRRCFVLKLTARGDALFQDQFPAHVEYLGQRLQALSEEEIRQSTRTLRRLAELF